MTATATVQMGSATENTTSTAERDFIKIAAGSTGLGLGIMLASLAALDRDKSGYSFHLLSPWVAAAFAVGAALGYFYWILLGRSETLRNGPRLLRGASAFLLIVGFGGFLYPLRFVPREKLPEILEGLAGAVFVLSLLGFMIWRIARFLERDAERGNK